MRSLCPHCGRSTAVTPTGAPVPHGRGKSCPGSPLGREIAEMIAERDTAWYADRGGRRIQTLTPTTGVL